MARKVFFSFHYERDVWRANVVRNSWVTKPNREATGVIDAAEFEKLRRQGDLAVQRWIDGQLKGTSVTAVLIGYETYSRRWVRYEIIKSFDKGNGLLGIYIDGIKNKEGRTDPRGKNPFDYVGVRIDTDGTAQYVELRNGRWVELEHYPNCSSRFLEKYWTGKIYRFRASIFDWVNDGGYENLGAWVEEAAKQAGR